MILEAIITTENPDGSMHVSAIGPHVNEDFSQWQLKPFTTSTTYANLRRTNRCVIHITDDVLLLSCIVTKSISNPLARFDSTIGFILNDACRVFGLSLSKWHIEPPRSSVSGEVTYDVEHRSFWGWNRGKHGILELAVAITRIGILPAEEIQKTFDQAKVLVQKTGGPAEHEALQLIEEYLKACETNDFPKL
jgi:uncharacterized protein